MGTNYYWHAEPPCPTCGHARDGIHIGKSSAGWCFSLHVDGDIQSLADWRARWETGAILNEYGDRVTPEEMLQIVMRRPRSDARHTVGPYCVGHGDGPYDLVPGYFR